MQTGECVTVGSVLAQWGSADCGECVSTVGWCRLWGMSVLAQWGGADCGECLC